MVRTQIQLTEEQHERLRALARQLGISLSEVIRRCVEQGLAARESTGTREARVREALAVVGRYADGESPSRVAELHDEQLDQAYRR